MMLVHGTGTITIPRAGLPEGVQVFTQGVTPGSRGHEVSSQVDEQYLRIDVSGRESGRWLYVATE